MLSLGDPEVIFVFHGDLAGDVLAAEGFVFRKPGGSVAVGLLLIGTRVDGEEIERVSGEGVAFFAGELLSAFLPGIGEGDDMVNLKAFGEVGFLVEDEVLAGVGLGEFAGEDGAIVGVEYGSVAELAFNNALTEIATIDGRPSFVELFGAIVAGLRGATFDF